LFFLIRFTVLVPIAPEFVPRREQLRHSIAKTLSEIVGHPIDKADVFFQQGSLIIFIRVHHQDERKQLTGMFGLPESMICLDNRQYKTEIISSSLKGSLFLGNLLFSWYASLFFSSSSSSPFCFHVSGCLASPCDSFTSFPFPLPSS
jgi:hypothetical protein